jgi:hypothetical protein
MKRWLLGLFVAVLIIPTAGRATGAEQITDFKSAVHVDHHNVADIAETITYNFGVNQRHGIFRLIPIRYPAQNNKYYYVTFSLKQVLQDGVAAKVEQSHTADTQTLKIGDPDWTMSGVHTYTVHYQLTPLIVDASGQDLLALDITGTGWEVPIASASATFSFDGAAQLSDVHCYSGFEGSTNENCVAPKSAPNTYSITNLEARQGMTVAGYLPAGYVDHYLVATDPPKPSLAETAKNLFWPVALGLAGLLAALIFSLRWWRRQQRRGRQTIIAQYEAPDGLTPGEIGTLDDDRSDMREITATLIDLAVRGYIKIIQTEPKKLMSKAKYRIVQQQDYSDVQDYERSLLDALFISANQDGISGVISRLTGKEDLPADPSNVMQSVDLDRVDRTKVSNAVTAVNARLNARLKAKGYYGSMSDQRGLIDKLVDTGTVTDSGAAEWAKVEGFKLYLSVAEKDRLNFTDAPDKTPERFNKLLPYAVALGVEKEWAKQFEGIDVAPENGWYSSQTLATWTAFSLADDLSTGFGAAVASNFVAPSSSGGSSSGGGFGGGGGGSW